MTAAKPSAGAPLTATKTPQGPPSAAVNTPQARPPAAARTPAAAPSVSAPSSASAIQPTAPRPLAKAPSTSQAADSSIPQSATEASSRLAQALTSSQAPAASLQDSVASAGKRPLLKPTAKLNAKELAAAGDHAKQASTASGTASSAATRSADLGTSSKAAAGTVLSPQGGATEQAWPPPFAKPGPHTANVSLHDGSPISTEPASLANPDQKLYRPAGPSSSSSSASASARQASTALRAAVRASAPLAAPPAALQVPSSAPPVISVSSSVSAAAAAAAAAAAGDAVRPRNDRPKPIYTSSTSGAKVRGPSISAADDDDIVDDDDAAAKGSGGHSQAERPTLPGSTTAKPHVKLHPTPTPSAVPGVASLLPPPIPFTVAGTRPAGVDAEEDDDFFAGVEADLGSVPSRDTNAARAGNAAGGHSHSQHRSQQASASQPSKLLAALPAQAYRHAPARTAACLPTAGAPVPAAATVPSATPPAASSATASAAASLATQPAAIFPGRSSSSRTQAFAAKLTAVEALATAEFGEPALAQSQQTPTGAQQPVAAAVDGASGVEVQSAFVPIPFGGSAAAAALHTGAGTLFGSQSDAGQDDLDDSFFDSINAGDMALA